MPHAECTTHSEKAFGPSAGRVLHATGVRPFSLVAALRRVHVGEWLVKQIAFPQRALHLTARRMHLDEMCPRDEMRAVRYGPGLWIAETCHRFLFLRAGYPRRKQTRRQSVWAGPKESDDKSSHSKGIRDGGEPYSPGTIVDPSSRIASMLR